MNDRKEAMDETRSMAPVIGFAIGALVGGGLALLFAPASGEKTRRRIAESARRMSQDARHSVDEAYETVTDAATGMASDVKSAIDAGRDAFMSESSAREGRAASRIAQALTPPTTRTP